MTPYIAFTNSAHWYALDDNDHSAASKVVGLVESIVTTQSWRINDFVRYAGLYGDRDLFSQTTSIYGRLTAGQQFNRLSYNIIRSMVDTVVSRHAAAQGRVEVLTEGGNWQQQKKAKKATRFIAGEFDRLKLYRIAPLALRDAVIFGDGFLKFYAESGKIHVERVFPGEIVVDDAEAVNGAPRSAFQVRYVSKETLKACYTKYEFEIETASSGDLSLVSSPNAASMVKVIEAWHLPSSKDAGDGKHIICIDGCVLHSEPWEYETFPWVRIRWNPALRGWASQGLADQLMAIQVELNKLLRRIAHGIHLMAIPYYLIESGSKVSKNSLNNEIGHLVEYQGTKPEARVNQAMSPEVYAHVASLYQKAYELAGISPLESQAKKPVGLDSRPALAEYADIASERHAYFSMEFQEFFKDCSWQIFRCARELHAENGNYQTRGIGKTTLEPVKWSDCELEDEDYTFKMAAANLLPTTPAGKKNFVQDLAQAGILTPDQALRLLQYPDIEAITGQMTAMDEYMDWAIFRMTVDETYVPPEPFIDLQKAIHQVNSAYLKGQQNGMPETALNLLRTFMRDAQDLKDQAQPPGPPPGPPGMPPPGAQPLAA